MGNNETFSKILLSAGGKGGGGLFFFVFLISLFFPLSFGFCFMKKAVFLLPTLLFFF